MLLAAVSFSTLDVAIVGIYLVLSVGIGLLANRFVTGLSGYLVAGRSLGTALAIATMTGSELGLITVMYQAEKGVTGGFAALHIGLIAGLVTLFVGLTGFIVVPLRRTGVMTIPEYYERRFGRRTRILGGLLLALGGILNMGMFLKVGSQFVVGVTGLDPAGGTLIAIMVLLLVLVLFYTVLGGMVSVVLTDYVQFVILSLGLVFMVVLAASKLGFEGVVQVVEETKGLKGFDPVAGHGVWYMSWQGVLGLVSCAIWPTAVTRALSSRDEGVVRRQYTLSSVSFMVRFLIPCFVGICAYAYLVQTGAEFYKQGETVFFRVTAEAPAQSSLEAFPLFLTKILPMGVLGLITAAMLAAFMSTHDSYLLCWASVITRDIVSPLCRKEPSTRTQLLLTRIFIVLIGAYVLAWGLFYPLSQDVWDYLGITGAVYFTGAAAVLGCGLYWRRASSVGAVLALLAGFSALMGLKPVQKTMGFEIDSAVLGLLTLALAFLAMVLGSLFFPDRPKQEAAT